MYSKILTLNIGEVNMLKKIASKYLNKVAKSKNNDIYEELEAETGFIPDPRLLKKLMDTPKEDRDAVMHQEIEKIFNTPFAQSLLSQFSNHTSDEDEYPIQFTFDGHDVALKDPNTDVIKLAQFLEKNRPRNTVWDSIKQGAPTTLLTTLLGATGSAALSKGSPKAALIGGLTTLGVNGLIDILNAGPRTYTPEELGVVLDKYYKKKKGTHV